MTNQEAIETIRVAIAEVEWEYPMNYAAAFEMAIDALTEQIEAEKMWHDAKTYPPKCPGLYYGKIDDTNSMYPCQYLDGVWTLSCSYPEQRMQVTQWAEWTAFSSVDQLGEDDDMEILE